MAQFTQMGAVTSVGGFVYIATNGAVRKVDASTGVVSTLTGGTVGCQASGDHTQVKMGYGTGMTTDGSYLYLADSGCAVVWKISLTDGSASPLGGSALWQGVTYTNGALYGVDGNSKNVYLINTITNTAASIAYTLPGTGLTWYAIASDDSSLWVAELDNDQTGICYYSRCTNLVKIPLAGGTVTTFTAARGTSETGANQLAAAAGYLYTLGAGGTALWRISEADGSVTVVAGQPYDPPAMGGPPNGGGGYADGVGPAALFNEASYVSGVAVDSSSIWVADSANFRLRRVTAAPTGSSFTNSDHLGAYNAAQLCGCQNGQNPNPNVTSNPVDAQTGNFWHTFTDMSIAGRGLTLDFQRTYNSDASALGAPVGLFGPGWNFTYGMSLTGLGTGTVTVHQENGSTVSFTSNGGVFTPSSPLTEATLTGVGGSYLFQRQRRDNFTFDGGGHLTQESDLNGFVTTIDSTNPAKLVVTDPAQRALTATITNGRITALADDSTPARTVQYSYNTQGELTDVIDVNNGHSHFGYDPAGTHRMFTMTSPRFYGDTVHVVTNHYDSAGRVDWQSDQLGNKTSFDYTAHPGSVEITSPPGSNNVSNVTQQTYLGGLLVAQTSGFGPRGAPVWQYAYDPLTGGTSEITDPNGNRTFNYYDSQGNLLTHVDNSGTVTSTTYNSLNEPLVVTGPLAVNGVASVTTNCYDAAGNILSTTRPDPASCTNPNPAETVFFHYHGPTGLNGDVTSVTDQAATPTGVGDTTIFTYDSVGDRASVTLPPTAENNAGDTTTYAYDTTKGWLTSSVSPKGNAAGGSPAANTTTYGHDPRGMINVVTDALQHVTHTDYDADGNVSDTVDGDTNTTTYTYDATERLTSTKRPPSNAPTYLTTDYWPDGSMMDQVDAAHVGTHSGTTYTYDPFARVATVTDIANRVTTYTYDGAGNVLTKQDPGGNCNASPKTGCTSYTYTPDSQPSSITYSGGTTRNVTSIKYNGAGQRTSMSDGGTTAWAWTYDLWGRLTASTDDNGAAVGYGYDSRNNVIQIVYPGSKTVNRDFDKAGRMDWVLDWNGNKTLVGYDPNSNLASETMPTTGASVVDSFTFDNANRLTDISDRLTGSPAFATFHYGFDNANQINVTTTGGTPGPPPDTHNYAYTPLNQVGQVDNGTGGTNSYDPADNPTRLSTGVTQTFDPANQICWTINGSPANPTCTQPPTGATTYGYDNRGNRTTVTAGGSAASVALGYDQANRLTSLAADTGANFTPISPTRIADTRPGSGQPYAGDTIGAVPLDIQVTGANGDAVPANATAVVLSVTAATSNAVTYLTVYPTGTSAPNTSALNVGVAGQVTDNQVTAKIGANGRITVLNGHGNTDVVVDVMGYYTPVPSGGAGYTPIVPARISDTRQNSGYQNAGSPFGPNNTTDVVQLSGQVAVPVGAVAAVVDITAFNDPSAGYLVGYANGAALPATANITYNKNVITTKEATIPLGPDGALEVTNGGGPTDMTIDVEGYYTAGTGSQYTPISPTRIADTRSGSGYPAAGLHIGPNNTNNPLTVQVANANGDGVPQGATAVVLNVTEVNATAASLFTVYPTGATRPNTTTVAFPAATSVGNEVTVQLSSTGTINIYNLNGTADAVVDIEGYFSVGTSQVTASYTYSGDGLRMSKAVNQNTQKMLWDQAEGLPLLLSDGTNNYIYGPGNLPLEQIDANGSITWFHHDQNGSTRILTNNTGTVTGTITYSPYGQITATMTGGVISPLGYNGQYTDPETGLIYLRARYYDPATAQFLSRDPLVTLTGSGYGFVDDNPLNGTDPSGLCFAGVFGKHCTNRVDHVLNAVADVAGAVAVTATVVALLPEAAVGTVAAAGVVAAVAGLVAEGATVAETIRSCNAGRDVDCAIGIVSSVTGAISGGLAGADLAWGGQATSPEAGELRTYAASVGGFLGAVAEFGGLSNVAKGACAGAWHFLQDRYNHFAHGFVVTP